eukprot:3410703-Rhodomonas_salina.1
MVLAVQRYPTSGTRFGPTGLGPTSRGPAPLRRTRGTYPGAQVWGSSYADPTTSTTTATSTNFLLYQAGATG